MPFRVKDLHDLIRIFEEQPEWRAELRRLVLTDELLTLPELVRSLSEAQARTEERLSGLGEALEQLAQTQQRTEVRVTELAQAQQRTEVRLTQLAQAQQRTEVRVTELAQAQQRTETHLTELAEAQQRTEVRVTELAQAQQRTEVRVTELAQAQQRTEVRLTELAQAQQRTETHLTELAEAQQRTEVRVTELAQAQQRTETHLTELAKAQQRTEDAVTILIVDTGDLKGYVLERRYREKAFAYLGRLIRRAHALSSDELADLLDQAVEKGLLSEDEAADVAESDVVVQGKRREDGVELYLVVEVSWGIGLTDVDRAVRRAELLARTGVLTWPVVAGKTITDEAEALAREKKVWQVIDGHVVP